ADYLGDAFKPLGVYLNFFQPTLAAGAERSLKVNLVNDLPEPLEGELILALLDARDHQVARATRRFQMQELGEAAFELTLAIPAAKGKYLLKAVATPEGRGATMGSTQSRRWVNLE